MAANLFLLNGLFIISSSASVWASLLSLLVIIMVLFSLLSSWSWDWEHYHYHELQFADCNTCSFYLYLILTVFWCFQGVEKGCIGKEWVKAWKWAINISRTSLNGIVMSFYKKQQKKNREFFIRNIFHTFF